MCHAVADGSACAHALQVFADARNFTEFGGADGLVGFMKLMNEAKRGDLIGVTGKPGKTKR